MKTYGNDKVNGGDGVVLLVDPQDEVGRGDIAIDNVSLFVVVPLGENIGLNMFQTLALMTSAMKMTWLSGPPMKDVPVSEITSAP